VVAKVESFLKEGRSQRETALQTGVSRGSVANIYHDRRKLKERISPADSAAPFRTDSPPRRCSVCGTTIYPPCQACQLRRLLASGNIRPTPFGRDNGDQDELVIRLSPDECRRYEEIHAAKLAADRVLGVETAEEPEETLEPTEAELRAGSQAEAWEPGEQ